MFCDHQISIDGDRLTDQTRHVMSFSCAEVLITGQDPSGSMASLTPGQQRAYHQPGGDMVPGTTTVGAAQHEETYDQLLLASQQVDHNTTSSSDHDHSNQPSSSESCNQDVQDEENKTAVVSKYLLIV